MVKVVVLAGIICMGMGCVARAQDMQWKDLSRGESDFRSVWAEPVKSRVMVAGSRSGAVRSEDGGDSWRNTLVVRGEKRSINLITNYGSDLFACTANGLFRSNDQGRSWNRVFKGKNSYEADCQSAAVFEGRILLGTKYGLFVSRDDGRSWQKTGNKLGNTHILTIVCGRKDPGNIYVVSVDGVFKSKDKGDSWENVLVKHSTENGKESEEADDDLDEEGRSSDIRYLAQDPNSGYLYLATAKGVILSRDYGASWENFTDFGLLSQDVSMILVSRASRIFAMTKSGVFEFRNSRWQELTFDLAAGELRFILLDDNDNLYVACEKGLFKSSLERSTVFKTAELSSGYFIDEPAISEVHKAAIKYAEVDANKISGWRKQAAKKALLPQLNVSAGRNSTDLWHWETGSSTKNDDDCLRRGHDSVDWDVSLSWDLGELIWNNDQTSIDTRSRLMVQLRDDILDEVNKAYFERIRIKEELSNLAIEDRAKRFEKELRLRELTASLDSLTGGFFSRSLKQVN